MKKVSSCTLDHTLNMIGGKWKLIILWYLEKSTMRFSELEKSITGISQKMLTASLRELESDGLISRKVFAVVPPKVEYSLTKKGVSLNLVLKELDKWGEKNLTKKYLA